MTKKKKTLPANFNELLEAKDLDALEAVFNECELNAYDRRSFKTPALSFYKIPLELMDWLIAQGADINAKDNMGAQCDRAYTHNSKGGLFAQSPEGYQNIFECRIEAYQICQRTTYYHRRRL